MRFLIALLFGPLALFFGIVLLFVVIGLLGESVS